MIKKHPTISLILFSILAALLWRIEVEFHGWEGLKWLSYFHWAVPIGLLLFLIWGNSILTLKSKFIFNSFTIIVGINSYFLFMELFTRFPFPRFSVWFWFNSLSLIISFLIVLKNIVSPFKVIRIIYIPVLIILSIIISSFILEITQHKGGSDFIHTIKSGIIIPFLFFSLGFPFIPKQKN